jgi:hypothetical protein
MTDGFAMVSATEPVRGASEPGGIEGDSTCILGDLPAVDLASPKARAAPAESWTHSSTLTSPIEIPLEEALGSLFQLVDAGMAEVWETVARVISIGGAHGGRERHRYLTEPAAEGQQSHARLRAEGRAWMRHSNPVSVWTRFAVLPLLALAIWSRDWSGWWSLIPIALSLVWMVVNPLFFHEPNSTKNWASKSVFGERIWTEGDRATFPPEFLSKVSGVTIGFQTVGLVILVYGLVALDAVAAVSGSL